MATKVKATAKQLGVKPASPRARVSITSEPSKTIALSFFEEEVDHAIATVRDNPRLRKAPLEEKLFTLIHSQLEYLAPYDSSAMH